MNQSRQMYEGAPVNSQAPCNKLQLRSAVVKAVVSMAVALVSSRHGNMDDLPTDLS